MQVSIINFKTAKENIDFRYEPEFFLPKYIEYENRLLKKRTVRLRDCALFENGRAFDSDEFTLDGYVYVSKIGDVTQKRDYRSWERVSKSHFEKLKAKYLKHNDILMTLTGDPPDVGKTQLVFNPPEKTLTWNQRVALIRLKKQDNIISPEYLFITLSTKYCREHIERWAKGIRQRNVGNPAVLNMSIPEFSLKFQNYLAEITKKAFNLSDNSYLYYSQAEQMLLSELGLLNWKPKHHLSFIKNLSDTHPVDRMDAEYFQPMYDEMESTVKYYKNGWDVIGNKFKQNNKGFKKESSKVYNYVEISCVRVSDGAIEPLSLYGYELPANAKIKLDKNDVIVSKVRPYRGAIGIVESDDLVGSSAFTVLREFSDINKETLAVLLRTKPYLEYSLKFNSGTSYPTINDSDILNFPIPLFPSTIQETIKQRIRIAAEAQHNSKALLKVAKTGVEMAIEKSEEEAIKWINQEVKSIA